MTLPAPRAPVETRQRAGRVRVGVLKEPVRTADAVGVMTWRDNWLGYVIALFAITILMFVWLDTHSGIERVERVGENVPAARR
jgi:hypothetical protein